MIKARPHRSTRASLQGFISVPSLLLLLMALLCARPAAGQRATVMCWNVENLFDCIDDSLTQDEEFLPKGRRKWTPGKLHYKQSRIARTIATVDPERGWPPLVGLLEVENDSVMIRLTRYSPLRMARYEYVITQSLDPRGIDVALMYQPKAFRLLEWQALSVPGREHGFRPTRDILHATGLTPRGDSLHVVIAHLPSRSGGSYESSKQRLLATHTLCHLLDSLAGKQVLLMGDFNAEPGDPEFDLLDTRLHHLPPAPGSPRGSYVYRHRWCFLDHILVSPRLAPFVAPHFRVGLFPFLLDSNGYPRRTLKGGTSDHLPLLLDIDWGGMEQ